MKKLLLFAVSLFCLCISACSTDPILNARAHLPFQWSKVVEPLGDEDLRYLEQLCRNHKNRPIVVSDKFSTELLEKLHGTVKENFVGNELSKKIHVVSNIRTYEFFRLYFNKEGEQRYTQAGFTHQGQFFSSGGGAGKPW